MKHQNYRAFTHNEAKSIVGRLAVGVDDKAVCLVVSYGPNKHTASKKQDGKHAYGCTNIYKTKDASQA